MCLTSDFKRKVQDLDDYGLDTNSDIKMKKTRIVILNLIVIISIIQILSNNHGRRRFSAIVDAPVESKAENEKAEDEDHDHEVDAKDSLFRLIINGVHL